MKLIAIDLDGTLLSTDCSISRENTQAIREAQKQGHIIVISSGRSFQDTRQILQNADLVCPFIAGNGAISFHNGEIIHKFILEEKVVLEIIETLEKHNCYYEINSKNGTLIKRDGRSLLTNEIMNTQEPFCDITEEWALNEIELQYNQFGLIPVPHYRNLDFAQLEVYKIFILSFNRNTLTTLRETLSRRNDISVTSSGVEKIDIGHIKTSKGNGLKIVANYMGIPLENTVAIGDNLNDLSMFDIAGTSIAMGNAVAELKKKGTYITKDHDENGIAFAFQNYILK
nr:Cof-type HAD-IIB family hydrolase [uncultured Bacillus sp.]